MNSQDFTTVYTKEFKHVENYITSKISDREQAKDYAQQTFQKLFENLHKYESLTPDTAIYMLFKIANNLIKNAYRDKKNTANLEDVRESDIATPENVFSGSNELKKAILDVLFSLDKTIRRIFILYFYRNMKTKDIAIHLKMNHSTVRKILHDNKPKIRKQLEKLFENN